jgi:hypothetical protein
MDAERFNSAYRMALGITVLYALWLFFPHVSTYANLVVSGARRSQTREAAPPKMSAANLEAALRQANGLRPDAELRCQASRDWDYVCSYLPDLPSATRLHFGVNVDATRWVKVSPVVPVGTALPGPR